MQQEGPLGRAGTASSWQRKGSTEHPGLLADDADGESNDNSSYCVAGAPAVPSPVLNTQHKNGP